ncbi:MAG: YicC/YloC family endoribonuclease [Planctomycetia bacterium]|nr:YicC/YloC family endoribonuclease [Planctomycetia bacterium]
MLLSMTGYGSAHTESDGICIHSEIKAINNRFLKTSVRVPDIFTCFEQGIEEILRTRIARGSVTVNLRIESSAFTGGSQVNPRVLASYVNQAVQFWQGLSDEERAILAKPSLSDLLKLPGVLEETMCLDEEAKQTVWEQVKDNLIRAIADLNEMRRREGAAMQDDLTANVDRLVDFVDHVESLAPGVIQRYRSHLTESVGQAMKDRNLPFTAADLVREVALFTDRADISEETNRLRSHLSQFRDALTETTPCGKRLDFLTQEMFREVNTMGSKANSPAVTRAVVEMKSIIERLREMVQNVE